MRLALAVLLGLFVALCGGFAAGAAEAIEPESDQEASVSLPGAPRAAIVFIPWPEDGRAELLDELGRRGLAVGVASPSVGGYDPNQTVLDVSQGTRIASGLYSAPVPALGLEDGRRIAGWTAALTRADRAPGSVKPGLLAETILRAGGGTTYVGPAGAPNREAAVAAESGGAVSAAFVVPAGSGPAESPWRGGDLFVTRVAPGRPGLASVDAVLAARRDRDLVIVMRAPPEGRQVSLLPVAAAGLGGATLSSATTRRDGLVAATDLAPTVLAALGVPVPEEMEGQAMESGDGAAAAQALADRLDVILERRNAGLPAVLIAWLLALGALVALRGRDGLRTGLRLGLLTALWVAGLALLAGAIAPPLLVEVLLLSIGSLGLAALTDRFVRWPAAPAVPAAVVGTAYAIDLIAGSAFTPVAITGSNPRGGARFYGVGNELEILLILTVLLGAGAAVARSRSRLAIAVFAGTALLGAVIMGAGVFGADVGAVITLAAGAGVAIVACLPPGRRRVGALFAIAAPVLALAALVALDSLTGGGAHLSRSVVDAGSAGDLLDVAARRVRLSVAGLSSPGTLAAVVAALALLAYGVLRRGPLLATLHPGAPGFAAGIAGAFAATIVGALANDSGPLILIVGTAFLGFALAYARGRPWPGDRDHPHTEQSSGRTLV